MTVKKKTLGLLAAALVTANLCGCAGLQSIIGGNPNGESVSEQDALVDFVVEVEEGRDPIVLQLTDTQIIDSSQQRTPDRLGAELTAYWAKENKEARCYGYIRQLVQRSSPDLILLTGDIVYGEFDDDGSALTEFVAFMDSFDIPWAPVFGNHENESKMGVDWQCRQFENAENCLFKRRELTGNGNYSVGIKQGEKLLRVFYMLDSNGCSAASDESYDTGRIRLSNGLESDQIDWYASEIRQLKEKSPDTKTSLAFHIPMLAFIDALTEKYGYTEAGFAPIDLDSVGLDGDFGYVGGRFSGWDIGNRMWNLVLSLGIDSIFVGHEHVISSGVKYEGVQLQFGLKSSTYDALNYITSDGEIVRSYSEAGTPIVGGTVIPVSRRDGSVAPYHIYCEAKV